MITKINDSKISSPSELTKTIGKFNPDEKITITYKRDKKEQKTTATLTKRKNTAMALAANKRIRDESQLYKGYKDLNDWHCHFGKGQKLHKGYRLG